MAHKPIESEARDPHVPVTSSISSGENTVWADVTSLLQAASQGRSFFPLLDSNSLKLIFIFLFPRNSKKRKQIESKVMDLEFYWLFYFILFLLLFPDFLFGLVEFQFGFSLLFEAELWKMYVFECF